MATHTRRGHQMKVTYDAKCAARKVMLKHSIGVRGETIHHMGAMGRHRRVNGQGSW